MNEKERFDLKFNIVKIYSQYYTFVSLGAISLQICNFDIYFTFNFLSETDPDPDSFEFDEEVT